MKLDRVRRMPLKPRRLVAPVLLAGALMSLAGLMSSTALARNLALLVGVSDYPKEMVGDLQLSGPRNDVALMASTLKGFGFADQDVTMLGDGLEKAGLPPAPAPTRAAILQALARLAETAKAGDQVMVFLSGHGSQQPDETPEAKLNPSPDGFERLFLPIDIGPWNDEASRVENAITAEEMSAAIRKIRDKGAVVWLVVDACHSGGLTRGATPDVMAKKLEMERLRIPLARIEAARARAASRIRGGGTALVGAGFAGLGFETAAMPGKGGFVGFYAAHADQVALQRNLPRGYSADRKPQGVLTYYLVQAMRGGQARSFHDLALHVLAGYEQWGTQAPVPLFKGDLAQSWPGGAGAGGPRRHALAWREGKPVLQAGEIDELSLGTRLTIFDPADLTVPLGEGVIVQGGAHESQLELTPASRRAFEPGQTLVASVSARVTSFTLNVARPPAEELARAPALAEALAQNRDLPVSFVAADAPANLRLRVSEGRVWFLQEDAPLITKGREATASRPLGETPQGAAKALDEGLRIVVRARNFTRVAQMLEQSVTTRPQDLAVRAFMVRPAPLPQVAGALSPDDRPCENLPRDKVPAGAVALENGADGLAMPELRHCDMLYFELRNKGSALLDVSPLYLDGGGGLAYMGPPSDLRLEPGAQPQIVAFRIVTWHRERKAPEPIGLERLVFITVPQPARAALPANFRYLAQPTLNVANRSGAGGPLRALLEGAAFGSGKVRSATAGAGLDGAGATTFRWRVVAP